MIFRRSARIALHLASSLLAFLHLGQSASKAMCCAQAVDVGCMFHVKHQGALGTVRALVPAYLGSFLGTIHWVYRPGGPDATHQITLLLFSDFAGYFN
jgi:hypothetical protein